MLSIPNFRRSSSSEWHILGSLRNRYFPGFAAQAVFIKSRVTIHEILLIQWYNLKTNTITMSC